MKIRQWVYESWREDCSWTHPKEESILAQRRIFWYPPICPRLSCPYILGCTHSTYRATFIDLKKILNHYVFRCWKFKWNCFLLILMDVHTIQYSAKCWFSALFNILGITCFCLLLPKDTQQPLSFLLIHISTLLQKTLTF